MPFTSKVFQVDTLDMGQGRTEQIVKGGGTCSRSSPRPSRVSSRLV